MPETQTPAASPSQPQAPQQPASAPEPTALEKVYQEFGIEADAAQFQPSAPAPAPQPQPAQPQVSQPAQPAFKAPDPFDPNFGAYQAQLAQGVSSLHAALQQTRGELTAMNRDLQSRRVEADIRQAVDVITKEAGIEPAIAEVALEAKARQDPRFLAVWNNRGKNPQALAAALKAVSSEFAQKFTVRQDPQLVENQRAIAASRNQMATTQKQSDMEAWANMTPAERQAKVRIMMKDTGRAG